MHPAEIIKRIRKKVVQSGRINLLRRRDPVGRFVWIVVLKLPGRLGIVKSRRISCELKLFHHLLRATLFVFEQKSHVDLELNNLCGLIPVASRRLLKERFEPLARLDIIFFLKWNLREIILRFAKFRIDLRGLFKRCFCFVELLLLHQNLTAQINDRRLIRVGCIGFVDEFLGCR